MKRITLLISLCVVFLLNPHQSFSQSLTDTIFDRSADTNFAYGADISWGGSNLKDKNGVPNDLLTILEEQGLNALRFRVWYPTNGPSGKNEVVRQAKEAYDRGFKVMIDFHYSDSWADPGKQFIPSAWEGHTTEQLVQDVYDHTYDILDTLKKVGVIPAWVQIGNETKRGMLWPNGNTNDTPGGMDNFAEMIKSGYNAIKAIDSSIQAIVHLPDADENSLYRWMFDALKSRDVTWDIIGMSAYPRWAHLEWEEEINQSVANMKDMIQRYDTKVMVVETGHYWYEPYISNNFLVELIDTMQTFGGLGCFWWEPQSMFGYELTAWDPATRQPTIAMDAYLGVKHIDPATVIKVSITSPTDGTVYNLDETIQLTASAEHLAGTIEKVTFYINNVVYEEVFSEPYTVTMPNPGMGTYSMYASVTDNNGYVVKTDAISIQVGPFATFQENDPGYCGITNNAGSIDTEHANYTGSGFINTDNAIGSTINWTVNFSEPGSYRIEYRYATTSQRPGKVTILGENIGTVSFPSTGAWDVWDIASINYQVTKAGDIPISITSTEASGLPNIDYMSIVSLTETTKPAASTNCVDNVTPVDTSRILVNLIAPADSAIIGMDQSISALVSAHDTDGRIRSVLLYLNNRLTATEDSEPYGFSIEGKEVGTYSLYAVAIDDNGKRGYSDTITVFVRPLTIYQENAEGFCGFATSTATVDTNQTGYTGDGFINASAETGSSVNWTINFADTGKYSIQFRYASLITHPAKLIVDGNVIDTLAFESTETLDNWSISSINYMATQEGDFAVSLIALSDEGLPFIDYMGIASMNSLVKTEAAVNCINQKVSNDLVTSDGDKLRVYPVPAADRLIVQSSETIEQIKIYTSEGALIKAEGSINNKQHEISCESLSNGFYLIHVLVGNASYTQKITIQK